MANVNKCAECGTWTDGAYDRTDAPTMPWGAIDPHYRDSDPPRFCSTSCRTSYEAAHPLEWGGGR